MEDSVGAYREHRKKSIMCPVLATLYDAKKIVVDDSPSNECNDVEVDELITSLIEDLNTPGWLARFQAIGVVCYRNSDETDVRDRRWLKGWLGYDAEPRFLNIFKMHSNPHVRHGYGTAVRGLGYDYGARFDEFVAPYFIDGRLYLDKTDELLTNARYHGERKGEFSQSTDVTALNWQMTFALNAFIQTFGSSDEDDRVFMTLEGARKIYVEGKFPDGWEKRSWGSICSVYQAYQSFGCEPENKDQI